MILNKICENFEAVARIWYSLILAPARILKFLMLKWKSWWDITIPKVLDENSHPIRRSRFQTCICDKSLFWTTYDANLIIIRSFTGFCLVKIFKRPKLSESMRYMISDTHKSITIGLTFALCAMVGILDLDWEANRLIKLKKYSFYLMITIFSSKSFENRS